VLHIRDLIRHVGAEGNGSADEAAALVATATAPTPAVNAMTASRPGERSRNDLMDPDPGNRKREGSMRSVNCRLPAGKRFMP
jgi:hypothetical protein